MRRRHLQVANLARDSKRWGEARTNYEAALAEDLTLDAIWVQLGHTCKEMRDFPAAETAYKRALALRPDFYDTHLQLGHLFKVMGLMNQSISAYAKAARLQPEPNDATEELFRLGLTPDLHWMFTTHFRLPTTSRFGQGSMWFTLHAKFKGIAAPDVLGLHAKFGLQLGCALHAGLSTSPSTQAGIARIDLLDEATLQCQFVLAHDAVSGSPQLGRFGFFYGEIDDCEISRRADTWMVIDPLGDSSLGQYYQQLTGTQ